MVSRLPLASRWRSTVYGGDMQTGYNAPKNRRRRWRQCSLNLQCCTVFFLTWFVRRQFWLGLNYFIRRGPDVFLRESLCFTGIRSTLVCEFWRWRRCWAAAREQIQPRAAQLLAPSGSERRTDPVQHTFTYLL